MADCAYCGECLNRKDRVMVPGLTDELAPCHAGECARHYEFCSSCGQKMTEHRRKTYNCVDCGNPVPNLFDCIRHSVLCDVCAGEVKKQLMPQVLHEMSTMAPGESRRIVVQTSPHKRQKR